MDNLKNCPFCGGAPTIGFSPRHPLDISCENCPVIVETDVGAFGDAVTIWNTRASTPRQLDAEVAESLKQQFGYVPDLNDGEKWSVFEDSLMVMHGRYGVKVFRRGCQGSYYEMVPYP